MGRPKKLTFPCSYCDKEFKRKISLNKHLLCHPNITNKTRVARVRSNWCHVCRRSFAESEYKCHIETEHKFDNRKIHSGNTDEENECKPNNFVLNHEYNAENFVTNEDSYFIDAAANSKGVDKMIPAKLYKKRGRPPGKTFQNASSSSRMKIKTEPPDTYETNVSVFESKNVSSNSPSVACKICGFKCKTLRGIKIHFSTIHKKKCGNKCMLKKSPQIQKIAKTAPFIKQEPQDEDSDQVNNCIKTSIIAQPLFTSNNSVSNVNQNAQIGMIYNTFQNQPFYNFSAIANQPNIHNTLNVANQNQQVETIPMFDFDSEKYIKWLKKFISRCKMHKYPLTPMLCQSVNHIYEEITRALSSPEGSLRKRSNHFYFMKIKSLLHEIMIGQLRYSMDVVIR